MSLCLRLKGYWAGLFTRCKWDVGQEESTTVSFTFTSSASRAGCVRDET